LFHTQLFVDIRNAVIAGSTGRMAMLLLIYGGPLIGLPRIDVVSMLGSLAAPNKQDAVTLGGAIHFSMGVLFAIIYAAFWSIGIGRPTWWWGVIFGTIHGILVILLVFALTHRHPQLSASFNGLLVAVSILLDHIVFGVIVSLVY
jgi:hypothetical protein